MVLFNSKPNLKGYSGIIRSFIRTKQVFRFGKVLFLAIMSTALIFIAFPAYADETSKQDDNWYSNISVEEPDADLLSDEDRAALEAYEENGVARLSANSISSPDRIPATAEEIDEVNALLNSNKQSPTRAATDISFDLRLPDTTLKTTPGLGVKEDDSSFYLYARLRYFIGPIWVYTLAYNGSYWNNYTHNSSAQLSSVGEFQIYNDIYETLKAPAAARLAAQKPASSTPVGSGSAYGTFQGAYSPDCILYYWYPVLNP